MKKKNIEDIRKMELGEIEKEIVQGQKDLTVAYANLSVGNEKNLKTAFHLRREIARLMTIKKEKSKKS